ncbi:hypothetical protein HDU99_005919 [Rhizoclosmatium hyalinum]|nr:hypothetical protein HDU99_005919 [Rhizoclosmatium hyalinum]
MISTIKICINLSELPDELLIQVFSWITPITVFVYRRLSHRFKRILETRHFATCCLARLHEADFRTKLELMDSESESDSDDDDDGSIEDIDQELNLFPFMVTKKRPTLMEYVFLQAPPSFQDVFAMSRLKNCRQIYWSSTYLSPYAPIPVALCSLSSLVCLVLRGIRGEIPPEIGRLSSLKTMNLSENFRLVGRIPVELCLLKKLVFLDLNNCSLSGPIPDHIGNLTELQELHLNYNQLDGPIPSSLGKLLNLIWLNLRYNKLTGVVPAELGLLSKLQRMKLQENMLEGPIPPQLGKTAFVDLKSNQIIGDVPCEVTAWVGYDFSQNPRMIASIVDLSFALPARKKFTLAAHKNALVLTASASDTPVLSVPTESITSLLVLPTPHKPKQNFSVAWTVSSSESDLIYLDKAVLGPSATSDAFLFTFDNAGTQITFKSSTPALDGVLPKPAEKKDRIVEILRKTFEGSACHIEEPSMNVFNVSLGGKLGRQGVCWVDGLVKMKDGHFYMLPNTIFYGFKKPLLLVPIPQVRSISFAFITSRTFTLLVHYYPNSTASSTSKLALETFELEMVDKSELEGVLAYFKGRGVPVASAEELLPGENGNGSSASGSNKGKVVVLGAGEVADGDEDGEAVDASKQDVNGNALFDEDEEDDEDFVANDESDGDDLDEEYDSEHQTDDGSTDDEGDDDDDDEEDDDEDEEPEKIVLLDDDDDMDAEPSGQRAASEPQVNSRKRKSEDTLTAAESGKSKRQFIAVDDEDVEDEDEEDVDELAL